MSFKYNFPANVVPFIIIFILFSLVGCSGHRVYSDNDVIQPIGDYDEGVRAEIANLLAAKEVQTGLEQRVLSLLGKGKTVFVHPGLLFLLDWGGGRAVDSAEYLIGKGYVESLTEDRSRDGEVVYEQLLKEDGEQYLGLHYSFGATPKVLAKSLQAVKNASNETGRHILYSPLLVEPHSFAHFSKYIDIDDPHLGNMILIISSAYSFLRPGVEEYPKVLLNHPKIHILYAEDLGVNWNHFSFLSDVRKQTIDPSDTRERRAKRMFDVLTASLLLGLPSHTIDSVLSYYLVKFSIEDKRELHGMWLSALLDDRFLQFIKELDSLVKKTDTNICPEQMVCEQHKAIRTK